MENGTVVFLRVKVCLIHMITTLREVRKNINLHGLHLAFPSYRANCICSLPCNIKDPILSQVISILKASCKDPGNPLNGRKIDNDFRHKKTVSFTCQNNYVIEGARTVTCLWSAKRPICHDKCKILHVVQRS